MLNKDITLDEIKELIKHNPISYGMLLNEWREILPPYDGEEGNEMRYIACIDEDGNIVYIYDVYDLIESRYEL